MTVRPPLGVPRGTVSAGVLVGRGEELAMLAAALCRPPAVAIVEGEAGVGKTRLVHELPAWPELVGHRFIVGSCRPIRDPFPLGPVLDAARTLAPQLPDAELSPVVGALRPLLPELSAVLPAAPRPLGDRASERHRIFRALVEVFAAADPAVLVLEDLHWSDEQTVEFISYVLADPPATLSLVLTFRGDQVDGQVRGVAARLPRRVTRLHVGLAPLDVTHTGALAAKILGVEALSAPFASKLHARSSGLPLAVEELVAVLRQRGARATDDDRQLMRAVDELEVPPAIRDYVLERVSRLPEAAYPVLEAAAVLAHPVPEQVVGKVLERCTDDAVAEGLSQAISAGLLVEHEHTVGFRHALAAQAVYDGIPGPRRRMLHRRVADVIAAVSPGAFGQVAHHLKQAGRVREWATTAEQAADQASALGHDDEATRLLEDVLQHAELAGPDRGRVAIKLGQAAMQAARGQDVLELLRAALDDGDLAPVMRGELRVRLAALLDHTGGDTGTRRRLLVQAVEELDERPDLRAWAMLGLGIPRTPEVSLAEHAGWLRRSLATLADLDDPMFDLYLRGRVALVMASLADPQWRPLADDVVARTGGTPSHPQEVLAYESLANAACYTGEHRRARQTLEAALRVVDELDSGRASLVLRSVHALLDFYCGSWDGLPGRLRRLRRQLAGLPLHQIDADVIVGCLSLPRQGPEEAIGRLRPLVDELHRIGAIELLPLPSAALVRGALAMGDVNGAAAEVDRLLTSLPGGGAWVPALRVLPAATEAMLAQQRTAEARALVDRYATELATGDAPLASPVLRYVDGLLEIAHGDHRRAAMWFAAAAEGFDALPSPYEGAQAREQAALALFSGGSGDGAEPMRAALATYQRLGAAWDLDRAARLARQHGVRPPTRHRQGRHGYGGELTPRERQVAALAATGRTNKEIARELYVQPDTVNKHLGAAMRKLDVRSRTALAHRLAHAADGPPEDSSPFGE